VVNGIRELYELQALDLQIDAQKKHLGQIDREIRGSPQLIAAKAELAAREARSSVSSKTQQAAVEDASGNQARMVLLEARMYGSEAGTRELQSIIQEIANLKERQSTLETVVLHAMEAAERDRASLAEQRRVAEDAEAKWGAQLDKLGAERDKVAGESGLWQTKRDKLVTLIPQGNLRTYDQIRAARGNVAVAKVERGVCGGCRMTIPTVLVQKARTSTQEFIRCTSCGRLLYVG